MHGWLVPLLNLLGMGGGPAEESDAAVFVVCVTGGDRRVITVTGYTGGPGCR